MKRTLVVVAVVVGFAAAASAATLTVVSNKTTYLSGEAITLTVSGNSAGATAYGVYGRLLYTGAGGVTPNTQTQKLLPATGTASGWATGSLGNGAGFSESFNQGGLSPQSYAGAKDPFSTVTLVAGALGVVNVNWEVNEATGNALRWFGIQSAGPVPGTTFTIIPEPRRPR